MLAKRGIIRSPVLASADTIETFVCGKMGSASTISMPKFGCGSKGTVDTAKSMAEIAFDGQAFIHFWHKVQVE